MIDQQPATEGRAMRHRRTDFIEDALLTTANALTYRVGAALAARFAGRAVLESDDTDFDVEAYASAGHCALAAAPDSHVELSLRWDVDDEAIERNHEQGWYRVEWRGSALEVLRLSFTDGYCTKTVRWVVADTQEGAEAFFEAVARFNSAAEGAIMVFQDGYWQKDHELYQTIKGATLANLVLAGTLKDDLYRDLRAFFDSRAVYERSGVPWKRGIVLIGPPGNGKTHAIKALLNALDTTCLYVKSFSTQNADDHHNIRNVFREARDRAPCILVLEDLDSLITDHNRSFFLNELDGFASNEGVVTIASTNHPERLDPAIMARPSRFDRKYHFGLPAEDERLAYLELWRARLDDAMRPSAETVAALAKGTEGFSFAYVKELMVAATVRWAERQEPGTMNGILSDELTALREQMRSLAATS
jgi:predicted AAA+ superfamily ATPase